MYPRDEIIILNSLSRKHISCISFRGKLLWLYRESRAETKQVRGGDVIYHKFHASPRRLARKSHLRDSRAAPHKERVNDVPTPFVTIILRLKSEELALRPVQVHVQNESSLVSQIARFVRATLKWQIVYRCREKLATYSYSRIRFAFTSSAMR